MKIAISLPKEEFLAIEKLKGKLRVSRSRLVQQAIEYWLSARRQKNLIDKYEEGYRNKPEKVSAPKIIEKAQYEVLSTEDWQ